MTRAARSEQPPPPRLGTLLRIGEAAEQAGTSSRTLRYYEELGLLRPSRENRGGARWYTEEHVARLRRIRELQELLGFDLGEIGDILHNEDQLSELRSEVEAGVTPQRHRQILAEAMEVNARLRSLVRGKQERLSAMMQELDAKARRYRARAKELGAYPSRSANVQLQGASTSGRSGAASNAGASGKSSVQLEGFGVYRVEGLQFISHEVDQLLHCGLDPCRMPGGIGGP